MKDDIKKEIKSYGGYFQATKVDMDNIPEDMAIGCLKNQHILREQYLQIATDKILNLFISTIDSCEDEIEDKFKSFEFMGVPRKVITKDIINIIKDKVGGK